ncbi:R1 [Scenedesmus sp. PABB004]|nr:R1 [Scenedesmus sp. PABB004]
MLPVATNPTRTLGGAPGARAGGRALAGAGPGRAPARSGGAAPRDSRWPQRAGAAALARRAAGAVPLRPAAPARRSVAPQAVQAPTAPATASAGPEELSRVWYELGGITITAVKDGGSFAVHVEAAEPRPMVLHWAVNDWEAPQPEVWPEGTNKVDDKAVQTPFRDGRSVSLVFPSALAPERIVFVLKELQPENWINNGSCYSAQLKPPGLDKLVNRVLGCEGESGHWSLKDRFVLANDVLDGFAAGGAEGMAFMFTWLRMSSAKLLTWARKANYQSKDITWMQKVISERMTEKARGHPDPWVRLYARLALAGLPRGGGNGDDIRMGILHIMRENGIKEGHRPGHDEPFLEQWHQKLHQNTTPEDVTICEAYLAFLHSGSHDDYWRVLWENGRITREHLEGMHIPLKAWPQHLPHMINPMKGYLWTLKTCHAGADMDTAAEMAKGHLDGDTSWMVFDVLKNRNEWWVPGKIVEVRKRLADVWRGPGGSRDVLLLDIALDNYFRTLIERTDRASLSRDQLVDMVGLVLDNAGIAAESYELQQCGRLWGRIAGSGERWGRDWGLQALAAAQRVELSLAAYADEMVCHVQPHAAAFGERCGIDASHITNFGEEVVRGQPAFVLSGLLSDLERHLRQAAGAGAWQVVSQVPALGEVVVRSLEDVQGQAFASPLVLLSAGLGGMEDIPPGITAVITQSSTDVLSHVAIRARSQGVLLASCFDDDEWARLAAMQGQHVEVEVTPAGDVVAAQVDPPSADTASAASRGVGFRRLTLAPPAPWSAWALGETQFGAGVVGAKANNLAALRGVLPAWIQVPASVALPFGTFEAVLAHAPNAGAAQTLGALQAEMARSEVGSGVPPALAVARQLVATNLQSPPELLQELSRVAAAAGLPGAESWAPGSATWAPVWAAICKVWASQWADRAWLSRQACGVPEGQLSMSVLLQEVVAAQYAFVLHTANPLTGRKGDMFGELVPGLGEVLVGNYPGRALSFSDSPGAPEPQLLSLPSKRVGLYAPPGGTLIARSDTNGEDLEAFAGAGLYDSVPVVPLTEVTLEAADEPLLWDGGLRASLIDSIVDAGQAVEAAFGGAPQDIEGVWREGQMVVVQARPQHAPAMAPAALMLMRAAASRALLPAGAAAAPLLLARRALAAGASGGDGPRRGRTAGEAGDAAADALATAAGDAGAGARAGARAKETAAAAGFQPSPDASPSRPVAAEGGGPGAGAMADVSEVVGATFAGDAGRARRAAADLASDGKSGGEQGGSRARPAADEDEGRRCCAGNAAGPGPDAPHGGGGGDGLAERAAAVAERAVAAVVERAGIEGRARGAGWTPGAAGAEPAGSGAPAAGGPGTAAMADVVNIVAGVFSGRPAQVRRALADLTAGGGAGPRRGAAPRTPSQAWPRGSLAPVGCTDEDAATGVTVLRMRFEGPDLGAPPVSPPPVEPAEGVADSVAAGPAAPGARGGDERAL